MSECLELEIIKPTESKNISVLWVEVEGVGGNFIVGPEHSPLVSILKLKGRLIYKTIHNLEVEIDTFGGIIKVGSNKATVILDK